MDVNNLRTEITRYFLNVEYSNFKCQRQECNLVNENFNRKQCLLEIDLFPDKNKEKIIFKTLILLGK